MPRTSEQPAPFVRLYVGGIAQGGTAVPFLKGCIRGMRIGNYHVNLGQAVRALGETSGMLSLNFKLSGVAFSERQTERGDRGIHIALIPHFVKVGSHHPPPSS